MLVKLWRNILLKTDNVNTHQEQHRCLHPLTQLLFLRIYSKEITHQKMKYMKIFSEYLVTNSEQPKCLRTGYEPSKLQHVDLTEYNACFTKGL